jgi:hypothetical protein
MARQHGTAVPLRQTRRGNLDGTGTRRPGAKAESGHVNGVACLASPS